MPARLRAFQDFSPDLEMPWYLSANMRLAPIRSAEASVPVLNRLNLPPANPISYTISQWEPCWWDQKKKNMSLLKKKSKWFCSLMILGASWQNRPKRVVPTLPKENLWYLWSRGLWKNISLQILSDLTVASVSLVSRSWSLQTTPSGA